MLDKFRNKRKNNIIYKSIIVSFAAIISLTFILGITLYQRAKTILEKTVYQYNEMLIDSVVNKVDDFQVYIDTLMNDIYSNKYIIGMLEGGLYNENDGRNVMYELQKMGDIKYISDIYIYIENTDIIISKRGIFKPRTFFEQTDFLSSEYDYESWQKEFLSGVQYKQYFLPLNMKIGNTEHKMLYYGQSFPLNSVDNIKGRAYILIDTKGMLDEIQLAGNNKKSSLFILDGKRRVLVSEIEDESGLRQTLKKMKGGTKGIVQSSDGEKVCVYARSKTGLNSWTCLYLLSKNDFLSELHSFRNGVFIILFIFLIIAGCCALVLTNMTYAPIKKAMGKIRFGTDGAYKNINEIDMIMEYLEVIENQKKELDSMSYKQTRAGKNIYLQRLIKNQVKPEEYKSMADFFGVSFPYKCFYVITVKPENHGVFYNEMESEWKLLSAAVANILEELLKEAGFDKCYVLENKIITALINFSKDKIEDYEGWLSEVLVNFIDIIKKELDVDLSIGVSDSGEEIECISTCYNNALTATEFEMEMKETPVGFFSRIKDMLMKKKLYYYPFESEKRIVNHIRQGDFEAVSEVLDEVMSVNMKLGLADEMEERLCGDLTGTLLRAIGSLNIDKDIAGEIIIKYEDLRTQPLHESFMMIKEKYKFVCDMVDDMSVVPKNGMVEEIENYIQENYMNLDMGVSLIADKFGITRQNVFNLFKKNIDITPSDYILRVRIEKAKQLLKESRLNNSQIANAIGFASDVSFVRVFKKYEGITPKKYRDMKAEN